MLRFSAASALSRGLEAWLSACLHSCADLKGKGICHSFWAAAGLPPGETPPTARITKPRCGRRQFTVNPARNAHTVSKDAHAVSAFVARKRSPPRASLEGNLQEPREGCRFPGVLCFAFSRPGGVSAFVHLPQLPCEPAAERCSSERHQSPGGQETLGPH